MRGRESRVSAGLSFAFDEVIDPAETRDRIIATPRLSGRPERFQSVSTWTQSERE
jgi:hypothetical protein